MEFWLSFNNGAQRLRLPVLPSSLDVQTNGGNTSANINDVGEINLLGKVGLKSITLESFFPAQEYSFVAYKGFPAPFACAELIEQWWASGRPIRLLITTTNINHAMGIESFRYGLKDASGDLYYTLALKEYRFLAVGTPQPAAYPVETSRPVPAPPTTYIVKSGDTLMGIAKKLTGSSGNWQAIAKKNSLANPNRISIGQTLRL